MGEAPARVLHWVGGGGVLGLLRSSSLVQELVEMYVFSLFFSLLNVLEVIAPFKHFDKLKEFVSMKLPPGFPVRVGMFN